MSAHDPVASRGVCRTTRSTAEKFDTPPDLRVARLAAEQHGCVSLAQLQARGVDSDGATVRVRNGRLHRIHQGVYAVGHDAISLHGRFMAAVLACGVSAVLSHFSAAALWEIVTWEGRHPEVTVVGSAARRRPGLLIHRARILDPRDVTRRHGIPVTTPARTLLDLAAVLPPHSLRRAVRQAQAERWTSVRQLVELLGRANGHRGAPRLAAIVADGPAPTRSGGEDLVLDLVLGAGLAHPKVNEPLWVDGRCLVPDLRWPEQRLIVEIDSDTWHDGPLARQDDAERQALLEAAGERVLRVHWRQAVARPRQTLARFAAAGAPYTDTTP